MYRYESLRKQMDLIKEEEKRQRIPVLQRLREAKDIQHLLSRVYVRQKMFEESMQIAAALIRRQATEEGRASEICVNNAEAQAEAASVTLKRLSEQIKNLPELPDIPLDERVWRQFNRVERQQKDLYVRMDEMLQKCSLPLQ